MRILIRKMQFVHFKKSEYIFLNFVKIIITCPVFSQKGIKTAENAQLSLYINYINYSAKKAPRVLRSAFDCRKSRPDRAS